jgi:hypothetical protein
VAASRPEIINTLHPTCPLYPLKFANVYDATEEIAYVGYTPGYLGCYVLDSAVVYGTGYSTPSPNPTMYYPHQLTYGFDAAYDSWHGVWGFRQPLAILNSWLPSEIENREFKDPLKDYTQPWWGVAGYKRFAVIQGGEDVGTMDLGLGGKGRETLYDRHPEWLAKDSWGRRLAKRVESTPPTPTPPAPSQDDIDAEAQRVADARWAALKRLSEAEAAARAQKEAAPSEDYYSDSDGTVYNHTDQGWVPAGQVAATTQVDNSRQERRNRDLDRDREARERGGRRSRDLVHSTGSLSRSHSFDSHVGTMNEIDYSDFCQQMGFIEVTNDNW